MSFDILNFLQAKTEIDRVTDKEVFLKSCPQCGSPGSHASTISVSREKRLFFCWRCNYKGGWVKIIAKLANMSFQDAARMIGDDLNLRVEKKKEPKLVRAIELPPRSPWTVRSENYLRDRGISKQTEEEFGLYYCSLGKFQGRIIIPIRVNGIAVAFQGRAVDPKVEPRYRGPWDMPKNLVWFNLDRYRPGMKVVIVEGPFDVMKLHELGIFAICPLGKTISEDQIFVLTKVGIREIVLLQDQDALPFIGKTWAFLSRKFDVSIIPLLTHNDPAELRGQEAEDVMQVHHETAASLDWYRVNHWRSKRCVEK
jgi:DNA primase